MAVKISSKYQVVIPQDVRERLKLKPGTEVEVIAKGGIIYVVPVRTFSEVRERMKKYLADDPNLATELKSNLREKKDRKI